MVNFPFPQRFAKAGLRSLVFAPLLTESKTYGVLVATRRQPASFSSTDCEFLQQLSESVALAIRQDELHDALRAAYEDLRQTQEAVMQQERLRALGQMASGIAHDVNNALSPIAGFTALLKEDPTLHERARGFLDIIERATDDVVRTIARLTVFYRQREAKSDLEPVQLNRLAEQVIDLTRARWSDMPQQQGIVVQVHTELASKLPEVAGVESEIREALVNLIFNAVDAMPNGGRLTLRTQMTSITGKPSSIHLEVSDTGVGMEESVRRRCLEPFFTTKGERGTGLGLAMVFGIAQRHNAEVGIDSSVGEGTTVRLSFASAAAPMQQPTDVAVVPSARRILVIDDDPMVIRSLCEVLEFDGHSVVAANGGQAGIDVFESAEDRSEPFEIVITDMGMPDINGHKVAAAVKARRQSTPVFLLTGWGHRILAEGNSNPHVNRVLGKPPKLKELRAAIAEQMNSQE